jgi:hypothetical protein
MSITVEPVFQSQMMKAVRVHRFGGPEVLSLEQSVPIPEIRDNQVGQTHIILGM